ncbi:MAG TPA: HAD hydrolase family protein [Gemmata sp.]|nr:HAD hydrolase family protein [Gemmata sp.]
MAIAQDHEINAQSELALRAAKIQLLLLDVDGVLTDGSIFYTSEGNEIKRFHVRDGSGLKFWHLAGKRSAIISGRTSAAVERRAAELGISTLLQGQAEKGPAFEMVLRETGFQSEQVCAVGDDLPDLPVLRRAGLAVAVADACPEIREAADHVTSTTGGHGAVREAIEWLLKLQGLWSSVVLASVGH